MYIKIRRIVAKNALPELINDINLSNIEVSRKETSKLKNRALCVVYLYFQIEKTQFYDYLSVNGLKNRIKNYISYNEIQYPSKVDRYRVSLYSQEALNSRFKYLHVE